MPDVKELLLRSTLFEGAGNMVINTLLERAETIHYSAGQVPVAEATVTDRILMVFEGEIQLEVALQAPDQELKLLRGGPGTFLGLVNFFGPAAQPLTVSALTEVKALAWKAEDWHRVCEENPGFGWRLSQRIGGELVQRMSIWINQLLNTVNWGV
jgi:CRP-like cAMP-binding protein